MSEWIILVEAATDPGGRSISRDELEALARRLGANAALHRPDRYALQLKSSADRAIEALDRGLTRWEDAVAALDLPPWRLVRGEVFSEEQLEWEQNVWEQNEPELEVSSAVVPLGCDADAPAAAEAETEDLLRDVFRDRVTGLPNETALRARLERALAAPGPTGLGPAVVLLHLDGFDATVRRFGHNESDQILSAVGQLLATLVRPGDLVARYRSHGFGILLHEGTNEAAVSVSQRVVSLLRSPFAVESGVPLHPSVGVALSKPGQVPEEVLAAASTAVSRALEAGGDRWEVVAGDPERPSSPGVDHPDGNHDPLSYLLVMLRVAAAANDAKTLREAARVVLRQVCAHTGWPVGHLLLVSPERGSVLTPTDVWHLPANDRYQTFRRSTEGVTFGPGTDVPGRVLARAEPVWISDLSSALEPARALAAAEEGLRTAVAFPVRVGDEVVAVLEFFSPDAAPVNGSLLEVLAGVGTQLGRIVERRRAHDALRESQALLREAQALGRLGSWHTDLRTGRTSWSDELYDLLGLDRATTPATLDSFLGAVHPEDRGLVEADARKRAVIGPGDPLEFRVVRPDGDVRWVVRRSSFVSDQTGDLVAFHATVQDVTEHKRTAECSLSCEIRWHLMLQGSRELLTLVDEDGTLRASFAPAGMDALGSADGDSTMFVDAVHPDDVETVRSVLAELVADPDSSIAFEARFRDDAGEWHWFNSIASNLVAEPLVGAIVINSLRT